MFPRKTNPSSVSVKSENIRFYTGFDFIPEVD